MKKIKNIIENISDYFKKLWHKFRVYMFKRRNFTIKRVCLIEFDDEYTYANSIHALDLFRNKLDKNIKGLIYGNIEKKNGLMYEANEQYITHSISNLKIKKKAVYADIQFLTTPDARIMCNKLIEDGFDQLEVIPKLRKTNNIIHEIYRFNCTIKGMNKI